MRRELQTLSQILKAVRDIDDNMPAQTLSVLLEIAKRMPVTVSDLASHAELSQSSASRNVAALSGRHWLKRPGLGLVQLESDPSDIRKKLVTLTPKGQEVIEKLVHTVIGGRAEG